MNQFKQNTKKSFKQVKKDMDNFKGTTEKYLLHLIKKQKELEARLEELELTSSISNYS